MKLVCDYTSINKCAKLHGYFPGIYCVFYRSWYLLKVFGYNFGGLHSSYVVLFV